MNKRVTIKHVLELTKPRITIFQLFVVSIGYFSHSNFSSIQMNYVYLLLGTLCMSAVACILNHVLEVDLDALMPRTKNRPLVLKNISIKYALMFSLILFGLGAFLLALVNMATLCISVLTIVLYIGVYTPLKRKSWLNTFVGAIPGALPLLGGWLAFKPNFSAEVYFLTLILFLWQIPHFFSLALLYEKDYKSAGFKMISTIGASIQMINRQIFLYLILLLFSVVLPVSTLQYGVFYCVVTLCSLLFCFYRFFLFYQYASMPFLKRFFLSTVIFIPLWVLAIMLDQFYFMAIL